MAEDNLLQVLEGYETTRIAIGETFMKQCLEAAALSDNHQCVGKLVKMGAKNIHDCLALADKKRVVNAKAMLLLMKAALTGDKTLLPNYRAARLEQELWQAGMNTDNDLQTSVSQGRISTIDALEVAQRTGHHRVKRELLLLTKVDKIKGAVDWSEVRLLSLDVQLLNTLYDWVTKLDLSTNILKRIPAEICLLNKVTDFNISNNMISDIPASLLQLPSLEVLSLSYNKITHLPDIPMWSAALKNVDLSNNLLTSMPMNITASALTSLNLSNNKLSEVPLCVCTFTTLEFLDISDNPNIKSLPYEMGVLSNLQELKLNRLKRLQEPPKCRLSSAQQCVSYLQSKLDDYTAGQKCMQVMIVGNSGVGKSLLASRMCGKKLIGQVKSRVFINEWQYRPNITKQAFHFRNWIFESLEDYRTTHPCFLLQRSLYLLLFRLSLCDGVEGVCQLKPWLESISRQAPCSAIIIVGIHFDKETQTNEEAFDLLQDKAKSVVADFGNNLKTIPWCIVELKQRGGNIVDLMNTIYNYAVDFPFHEREIIKEVKNNSEKLHTLFEKHDSIHLSCLNHALKVAVDNDNPTNVGILVANGAGNISDSLQYAEKMNKPRARAMLMLIGAAQTGDNGVVKNLLDELVHGVLSKSKEEDKHKLGGGVQKAVLPGNISPIVPLDIARQNGQDLVREEILLKTSVNQGEGYVYWNELKLLHFNVSWLEKITWVKHLRLAGNSLKILPPEIGTYLKQVVKIDIQNNNLTSVPECLLELPKLEELNLSSNKLTEIPDVAEWSPFLTVLDLSNNLLTSLPRNIVAQSIRSINLSRNQLCSVPLCICSWTTLYSLDLSFNPNIQALPVEMGRLSYLSHLGLDGLKSLNNPPKSLQKECRECISYLERKFYNAKRFYCMKLMVLGCTNRGKTMLTTQLRGKKCNDKSTVSELNISEWLYRPSVGKTNFCFRIWDFNSERDDSIILSCQCFLTQNSMYLLVFNLLHGNDGIEELKPWLNNIAIRAPHSCVIIIGTHLDQVSDEKREDINTLLHCVKSLATSYRNRLKIVDFVPVGLKNHIENVGFVKETIYNHAANYKNQAGQLIMGQKVPRSYRILDKQLETVQHEVKQGVRVPIMHAEEFRTMVYQMNFVDIQEEEELKTASLFLSDVGSFLHCDDRGHNLHELYFIDPGWLSDVISTMVVKWNPYIKDGILCSDDISKLFRDKQFPWEFLEQYIALLDRFEIAFPLNDKQILIPSALPDKRPRCCEEENGDLVYSRLMVFTSGSITAPGFWGRLLSWIMYSVPEVSHALGIHYSSSESRKLPSLDSSVHSVHETSSINTNAETTDSEHSEDNSVSLTDSRSPSPFIAAQDLSTVAPQRLPNFPEPIHSNLMFDTKDIHLNYWQTGLCYRDPEVTFRVESLGGNNYFKTGESRDGVLVVASTNNAGKKFIGQVVALVETLINTWYPNLLRDTCVSNSIEHRVPCFECVKQGRANPFEFKVEQCVPLINKNEITIKCSYFTEKQSRNHTVLLSDVVPELFQVIHHPEFALHSKEIVFEETDVCMLDKGTYAKVYRGKCKGKAIAIKKYISSNDDTISRFCWEAKMLQELHHHGLVRLIGISIYPSMSLVLEEAPLKSIHYSILQSNIPVHRLTTVRIATEVASALCFLHQRGIIFRDVKASNVLLWTLDPDSLFHCKLTDFRSAVHASPIGARGLQGTKGFVAPEVLYTRNRKQCSTYDNRADIFSFGMFLYQIVARRNPYHNIPHRRIDDAVMSGERPKLHDVDVSCRAYHYLSELMKLCWESNPNNRPDMDSIIKGLCSLPNLIIMCIEPLGNRLQLPCSAIAVTPPQASRSHDRASSELWVYCGNEISVHKTHSNMLKVKHTFIKHGQNIECIALCGNHVWVGVSAGINCRLCVIEKYDITSRALLYQFEMCEKSAPTCITAIESHVFVGTSDGHCLSFNNNISQLNKPMCKYVSNHSISSIICTQQCVWVAHSGYIHFLNSDNLTLEGSIHREKERDAYIGQLSYYDQSQFESNIKVWSAHLSGVILSAWDAHNKSHMYDVDTGKNLKRIASGTKDPDLLITAMTPTLDTVWVGMASGHIMIFHEDELIFWFHPYRGRVHFLTCIPSPGPCGLEEAMVASGGKGYYNRVLIKDNQKYPCSYVDKSYLRDEAIIVWEAYDTKRLRQMKIIEKNSVYLDSHETVCEIIHEGRFRDGTRVFPTLTETVTESLELSEGVHYNKLADDEETVQDISTEKDSPSTGVEKCQFTNSLTEKDHMTLVEKSASVIEDDQYHVRGSTSHRLQCKGEGKAIVSAATDCADTEEIKVKLLHTDQNFVIKCARPAKLVSVINEIRMEANLNNKSWQLFYCRESTELVEIDCQESFLNYLTVPSKPPLLVVVSKAYVDGKNIMLHPKVIKEMCASETSLSDMAVKEGTCDYGEELDEEYVQGYLLGDPMYDHIRNKSDEETKKTTVSTIHIPLRDDNTWKHKKRQIINKGMKPTMQQVQNIKIADNKEIRIMDSVSPDWEDVAICMGFEAHIINTIKRDNLDSKEATRQLFMKWLEGKHCEQHSWEKLSHCLEDAGFSVIALDLQKCFEY